MKIATKTTQMYLVKGSVTFLLNAKTKLDSASITRLQADLIVGSKSHHMIAHEDIKVTIDADKKASLHMPLEFTKRMESAKEAMEYAKSILDGIDKATGNFTMATGKTKKFSTSNVKMTWISAEVK